MKGVYNTGMFWADTLLEGRKNKEVINDSWTPSGIVHMGSLKGPIIHDTLFRILKERKQEVTFMYGFDDMDPIDGIPPDLKGLFEKYLGIPIFLAPSPDGKGSFGDFYGNKMKHILDTLDIHPDRLYKTSEVYKSGEFDNAIRYVLNNADAVRKVYEEVYKKPIANDWYPLQVICPNCGKLGTTNVTGWDRKEVAFICEKNLVQWAEGCDFTGKISPFKGNAKMPWKVEWAAKWWTFGVTIEGAGKDHASAGGSYDVAMKLCKEVFKKETPLKIAYEFFLSGGKKMSSSKGTGLTGEELLEALPPEVVRFLMIKNPPNQAVEFTPRDTDTIQNLFDEYFKAADTYYQKSDENLARAFELSQIGSPKRIPALRMRVISQLVQMPNKEEEIRREGLEEWSRFARVWVEKYAPESEKFLVQEKVPQAAKSLSETQKHYLQTIANCIDKNWNAEDFQKKLYESAKDLGVLPKEAFSAIYLSLIGKDHGPKAAWLLLSLEKEFIKKRFTEVTTEKQRASLRHDESLLSSTDDLTPRGSKSQKNDKQIQLLNKPEIFSIGVEIKQKFSSISVGIAVIKGVNIQKTNSELEKEKQELLTILKDLTTEQLGQYPEIASYRKLYKAMGIDWHSRRPSPEALLRRIALKKGLYTVNTCVDAYNLIVMKHRISVGAFDLDRIEFPTGLRFAKNGEEILLLGEQQPTQYKEGEIAYFDKQGGYNIDFNYRDAQRTAVTEQTKNIYINVDGIYEITTERVEEVLHEACNIILKYCGGKIETFGVETGK